MALCFYPSNRRERVYWFVICLLPESVGKRNIIPTSDEPPINPAQKELLIPKITWGSIFESKGAIIVARGIRVAKIIILDLFSILIVYFLIFELT
jgi:hypothetical protein